MENPNEFWNKRYDTEAYIYGTRPNRYFQQQLDAITTPGRILLLAEGEGRNAVYAADNGWQVTAVDFSAVAREKALRLAAEHGVELEYHLADLRAVDLNQSGSWDVIALIYVHLSPEARVALHQKCVEALRPGGRIILEAYNPRQLGLTSGGPKDPAMLYTQNMLEKDFAGLRILEASESALWLDEGPGHSGNAEVVRLLCEKMC